ncbi:hypothetical protein Fmac_005268 [Flemingia macrophylla]|uniref:Uncharacterized protein n=1 Tax=Flemingia macrophylla TaxID=520843 RepID=A0ABD1N8M7_9FABA
MAPEDPTLLKLHSACPDLKTLLRASEQIEDNLAKMEAMFDTLQGSLSVASRRLLPLQSLAMSRKALDTRITWAVSPALALLDMFKATESLQGRPLELAARLGAERSQRGGGVERLAEYVACVEEVAEEINAICEEVEVVVHRLQEVVEFIGRTKAADQERSGRLREALLTLKALYESDNRLWLMHNRLWLYLRPSKPFPAISDNTTIKAMIVLTQSPITIRRWNPPDEIFTSLRHHPIIGRAITHGHNNYEERTRISTRICEAPTVRIILYL